jgi:hypothetical protein
MLGGDGCQAGRGPRGDAAGRGGHRGGGRVRRRGAAAPGSTGPARTSPGAVSGVSPAHGQGGPSSLGMILTDAKADRAHLPAGPPATAMAPPPGDGRSGRAAS